MRPFDIRSFSRFVTSSTVPTATGWNNQPPGRDLHPLENDTFARRTVGNAKPLPPARKGSDERYKEMKIGLGKTNGDGSKFYHARLFRGRPREKQMGTALNFLMHASSAVGRACLAHASAASSSWRRATWGRQKDGFP